MNIKLIALDLDGTTLGSSGISDKTVDALNAAAKKGVHVVIATGRTFSALPEDISKLGCIEYVISSNGAHINYLPEDKIIYSNCISEEAASAVGKLLSENEDYPIEVFTGGKAYIDEDVFKNLKANGSDYMNVEYISKTRKPVPGIYDFLLNHKKNIENINIHFRDLTDKERFWQVLLKQKDITVTSSFIHNIEIGGSTTSKATAIAELCKRLNVLQENVMACGDSPNDGAMIKAAGIGVAMGNADQSIKDIADFITLSNTEDGVAYAVKKFVL